MTKSPSSRLAQATGVLAAATGISRILGFIRDVLMAGLFGASAQAEAFVVAFRLPNILRDLVAEGAVASAIVPGLSRARATRDPAAFWTVSQALLTKWFVLLVVVGVAGAAAAPLVVRLVAPGFAADPEKLALTVRLTRLLFPFITLVGLWAYFMGLLNTLGHFAMPALGPAILNLAMIGACLWVVPRTSPGVVALTMAVLLGGLVQLLIQIPVAIRLGFRWRWRWREAGADAILRLLGPRVIGSAVYQANVLIDTVLASWSAVVGQGAVAALYFANRLVQLPLALFGTASAQASVPSLSERSAAHDVQGFARTLLAVLRMVGFVIVPSAVGLIVLARPIVTGLFERGAFDHRAALMTSQALACYALGLLAYAANKVLTGAFYALQDTWTPVKLAVEVIVMNLLLSLVLMWPLRIAGLALAAAATNSLNTYRLLQCMERRLAVPLAGPLLDPLGRITLASVLMGAACWALWTVGAFDERPLLGLPVTIAAGLCVYLAACWLLRIRELSVTLRWLAKLPPLQLWLGE